MRSVSRGTACGSRVRSRSGSNPWRTEEKPYVFNRTLGTTPIPLHFKLIGVTSPVDARDLWSHADLGLINDGYVVMVPVHGAALLKLK